MNSKKLVSAVLTATTILWGVGLAALPLANAQTASGLQAQITALLAQIQQLQAQLGSTQGTGFTSSYSFTRDLTVGSRGDDVTALQQLLINRGYLTAVSAPTGYFGSLTQAALGKFQAASGISPTAGYFGPKTRAFVNSMAVGNPGTPGTPGTPGIPPVVAPATGLAVSMAANNPAAGSLITSNSASCGTGSTGAARVPVFAVSFTAGNSGAVTLSSVNFHKTGVLADSSVSGAYLTQNGKVLAQYNSISNGVVSFNGMNLSIPAGQTVNLTLAIDVAGGLSAGNTTGFSLNAASDVTATDASGNAVTPAGVFPTSGSTFTVTTVSNPCLATLTIASSAIGTSVTAGTQNNLVGAWSFAGGNSKVWLKGLNFRVIGSANKGDIRNVKLMVNGTQVGATLATVNQDGTAYFDASAAPGQLNTGSNNIQVFADVAGSPSYNFQFEILNAYDVLAVDSQYNVPITVANNGGTASSELVTIQKGQITVTQDSATPTGNIAKGQSQITLAKFDVYAAGEPVKIKFLTFALTFGAATTTLSNEVRNISLADDAGGQVGSTVNTPPSGNACDNNGTPVSAGTSALPWNGAATGSVVYDCFGTSASPINYIVPANTTRVLSLKADIQTTADFSTLTASLTGNSGNLQGLISSQTVSSAGAQGSALSLASSNLTVGQNNAMGNQSVSAGVTNQKIGSYALTASSAEGVSISNLSIQASSSYFQNLRVKVGGVQFGTTVGVVTGGTAYAFSGSPFTVPAGTTVSVDVYADTLSSAATGTLIAPATILTALSGTGLVSNAAVSLANSVNGQNLTFAGAATIAVSADSTEPPAGLVVMGSTGNTLGIFRLTETSNVENVKVTDFTVTDTAAPNAKAAFSNLSLWSGSTNLGTAGTASSTGTATNVAASSTITATALGIQTAVASTTATGTIGLTIGFGNGSTTVYTASLGTGSTSSTVAAAIAAAVNGATGLGITAASTTGNAVVLTAVTPGVVGNGFSYLVIPGVTGVTAASGVFANGGGSSTYNYGFHFANPVIVPQANSVSLTLKGDAATYYSAGATDASGHTFSVATTTAVTALGATSNRTATVSSVSGATGNAVTVLRSVLTASVTPLGGSSHSKSNPDILGSVTLTANSAGSVSLNKLTITFGGSAFTSSATTTLLASAQLYDANGNNVVTAGEATSTNATTTTGGWMTWLFNTGFQISAGSPYAFQLRINSQLASVVPNTAESLSANIQNAGDVSYTDALDASSTPATILPTAIVPLIVNSVTYPLGN
ncbi:MAG: peptidoglycan-binding domain-containing protein [Minisyncoccia bacterium]